MTEAPPGMVQCFQPAKCDRLKIVGPGKFECSVPLRRCTRRGPREARRDMERAWSPKPDWSDAVELHLGRALKIIKRLQRMNPGNQPLAEIRNHIEGAIRAGKGEG